MSPTLQRNDKINGAIEGAKLLEESAVDVLEDYASQQVQDVAVPYDMEACLLLLKLYQFFPKRENVSMTQKLLLKALCELPSSAFVLSCYLVPERVQEDKVIVMCKELHTMLEECDFARFWKSPQLEDPIVQAVPEFKRFVREYAFNVLSISHQRCDESLAKEVLNLEGASLKFFLKNKEADIKDGVITFALTEHNQKRAQEVQSSVQVGYVARIF